MRLLVIGASRGIGLQVVHKALEEGHQVTACARSIRDLGLCHPNLQIQRADVLDFFALQRIVPGHDAVVIALGILPTFEKVRLFSEGTRNLIDSMHAARIKRLVVVTGIGAGDSKGHGGFLYDRLFQPFVLRTIYQDKERQEGLIRKSNLDWTIVRPGFLTNGAATKHYQVITDLDGVVAGKISRADVAGFILHELEEPSYQQQAPVLCY
ncbi:NAD(P)-dependent oxidoreductase [Pontibacterium sp.]|uniref:NAD(P)-dependent oxidoreductase n=1 Tax=Pontibacterium sp. TaxID=2036026 RepID=UPI003511F51E